MSDEVRLRFETTAALHNVPNKMIQVDSASDQIICSHFKESQKDRKEKGRKKILTNYSPSFFFFSIILQGIAFKSHLHSRQPDKVSLVFHRLYFSKISPIAIINRLP